MPRQFNPRPVVKRIWREIGYRPTFPRDLVQPVMETFDAAVVLVPKLSIISLNAWLRERGQVPIGLHADRALRGCLLARKGHGLIFLDGSLVPEERQFALAHEFAHFFTHYLEPRRRVTVRLGLQILPVLDGERPATREERLSGIIRGVPIGSFDDFLGRDEAGRPSDSVLDLETEADLVALELLAPISEVSRLARSGHNIPSILVAQFGLPGWAAAKWGRFIMDLQPRSDPVLLGIERVIKKNI